MTTLTRYTATKDIDLSDLQEQVGCVGSSKKWYINQNSGGGKHIALPVVAGEKYVLSSSAASANSCWCAYLTDSYNPPYTHQSATPHVSGYDRFSVTTAPITITIPEGCAYLAMSTQDGNEAPNSFTFTLQQCATENSPYTVNGIKCFQVTDTWDGEIDADGIQIDDAYNIDTLQITGHNSTEQLSFLAQIMNVKSQIRLQNYGFVADRQLSTEECEEVDVDVTIGQIHINKCFACTIPFSTIVNSVDSKLHSCDTISIDLTSAQIDTLKQYITDQTLNTGKIIVPVENLTEGVAIIYSGNLAGKTFREYTFYSYIQSPGNSIMVTDLVPTQSSKFGAELQFVTDSTNTQYPRMITAGRDNTALSLCSSFESYVTGTLHVSYGNNSSWTVYSSINGNYDKHTYEFNKNSFYIDDVLIGTGPSTSFTAEAPFTIFGEQNLRGNNIEGPGRIYHAYFYENGVLIADLYPAKNSSNVAGLYDTVRDKFFTPSDAAYTIPS